MRLIWYRKWVYSARTTATTSFLVLECWWAFVHEASFHPRKMFKARKERVTRIEIDWVAKGLNPQDAFLESNDVSSESSSNPQSPEAAREQKEKEAKPSTLVPGISIPPVAKTVSIPRQQGDIMEHLVNRSGRRYNRRRRGKVPRARAAPSSEEKPSLECSKIEELEGLQSNTGRSKAEVGDSKDTAGGIPSTDNSDCLKEAALAENIDSGASGSGNKQVVDEEAVIRRLLNLEISANGLNISEPEQEVNKQEQSDEVVALQAIFEEHFLGLEINEGKPQVYMVSIHVETPRILNVMVTLSSESSRSQKETSETHDVPEATTSSSSIRSTCGKLHACTLQYLPPIQLMCRLPVSYPSRSPPHFIIWARWLPQAMLSSLCKALDGLWEEQAGEVVIYAWAEWLRTCSLLHLGITDELVLDSYGEESQDTRAISGCSSPDTDIPWLMRYNEEQKNQEFLKGVHTCYICFTEQLGKNFSRLPCRHNFCYACMEQYATIHVKEGTVNKLHCPDTSCKGSIPPAVLKQLLGEEGFKRWESLLLQKTLDSMSDVVYCPRCENVCIEDEDHHAQCAGCFFNFCSLCRGAWHVGQACMSAESRLRILQERQKGSQAGEEQRKKEKELVNELLNMKYVERETKQCPACKMAISKVEGCNKVTCGNCGQYFCYRCNKAIEGYDHFREVCILFEQEEIERWEHLMNDRQRAAQARAELWPQQGRPCPNCRQVNPKEGNNNHIFCWSCQNHYCALCRKMVRRSSEHYGTGPNKCRQHTND